MGLVRLSFRPVAIVGAATTPAPTPPPTPTVSYPETILVSLTAETYGTVAGNWNTLRTGQGATVANLVDSAGASSGASLTITSSSVSTASNSGPSVTTNSFPVLAWQTYASRQTADGATTLELRGLPAGYQAKREYFSSRKDITDARTTYFTDEAGKQVIRSGADDGTGNQTPAVSTVTVPSSGVLTTTFGCESGSAGYFNILRVTLTAPSATAQPTITVDSIDSQ